MGLFDFVGDAVNFVGGALGLGQSGPGHASYNAQGGVPGVGAMNPYQANPMAIPVPQGVALNGFQATAPTVNFQASAPTNNFRAQSANMDYTNYAGAIQNARDAQSQALPGIQAGANEAAATAAQLRGLAGQNASAGAAQGIGGAAQGLQGLANQQYAQGTIGQQQQLANALKQQMAGNGPSLAQLQLQQATQQNEQQAAAQIGGVRGINGAMAARQIGMNASAANANAANQSAQLRMAEQLNAQQQLASVLNQQGQMQLGQQGLQGQLGSSAANAYAQQAGAQQAQQAQQMQGMQSAGNLQLGAGNLNLGQYGAATNAFGTAAGAQNAQNSNTLANVQQQNQYNSAVAAQNAQLNLAAQGMNQQTALANAGFNLQAQGLNQQTGAQNAQLGLAGQQLAQNAYLANQQNYMNTQQLNSSIWGQNAALAQGSQAINAGIAQGNAAAQGNMFGNFTKGVGGALGLAGMAHGGEVPYADGGPVGMIDLNGPHADISAASHFDPSVGKGSSGGGDLVSSIVKAATGSSAGADAAQAGGGYTPGLIPSFAVGGPVRSGQPMVMPDRSGTVPVVPASGYGQSASGASYMPSARPMGNGLNWTPIGGGDQARQEDQIQNYFRQLYGGGSGQGAIPVGGTGGGAPAHGAQAAPAPGSGPSYRVNGLASAAPGGMGGGFGGAILNGLGRAGDDLRAAITAQRGGGPLPQQGQQLGPPGGFMVNTPGWLPPGVQAPQGLPGARAGSIQTMPMGVPRFDMSQFGPDYGGMAPPQMASGGELDGRDGGHVPGQAQAQGDSPENDTVPAKLSPGEIVLPRSVTQAPDAAERAAAFVQAIRAQQPQPQGYGAVLAKRREAERTKRGGR